MDSGGGQETLFLSRGVTKEGRKPSPSVIRAGEWRRRMGVSEREGWWAGIPLPSCFEQESGGEGQEQVWRAGNARPSCFEQGSGRGGRERTRWRGGRWWVGIPPSSCFEQESGKGGQERVRRAGNARPSCFERGSGRGGRERARGRGGGRGSLPLRVLSRRVAREGRNE